jgi:hypothetical protein
MQPNIESCNDAGVSLVVCSACNLASPVISGILFEILTGRQPMARYPYFLGLMATLYTVEPLLTRVYIRNVCMAGEKVWSSFQHDSTCRGTYTSCWL